MRIRSCRVNDQGICDQPDTDRSDVDVLLAFGARPNFARQELRDAVRALSPNASVVFVSTFSAIAKDGIREGGIEVTGITFERTTQRAAVVNLADHGDSNQCGRALMDKLPKEGLRHVLVFSDGTLINGSDLVAGLSAAVPEQVTISGGLAGDGTTFAATLTGLDADVRPGNVVAVGLYGDDLHVGYGTFGGWEEFGPERVITASKANVLHTIDGLNALDLYKEYLGPYAADLPGSALLFPLSVKMPGQEVGMVRTILTIDEENQTMTFAGNVPEGSRIRLMKASFNSLIDAAGTAARKGVEVLCGRSPELALLISCIGRQVVLDQSVDEEVTKAMAIIGEGAHVTGFYSYGELSPLHGTNVCGLFNQTMTITLLSER
jgi:hypothetical protein